MCSMLLQHRLLPTSPLMAPLILSSLNESVEETGMASEVTATARRSREVTTPSDAVRVGRTPGEYYCSAVRDYAPRAETMTLGSGEAWGTGRNEARCMFDAYRDRGGNIADTATAYPDAASEELLWEFAGWRRDELVIALYTAALCRGHPNSCANHPNSIIGSVEPKLRRTSSDYIDLLHVQHARDSAELISTSQQMRSVLGLAGLAALANARTDSLASSAPPGPAARSEAVQRSLLCGGGLALFAALIAGTPLSRLKLWSEEVVGLPNTEPIGAYQTKRRRL